MTEWLAAEIAEQQVRACRERGGAVTARIIPLPEHADDCEVCGGGEMLVQVHALRWRDGEQYVSTVGRIRPCPLASGAHALRALLGEGAGLPDGPGGAA